MVWYNPFTWKRTAEVKLEAQPIQVNPGNANALARHAGRLANLFDAQKRQPDRADLAREIEQRKRAITAFGHPEPQNAKEARALLAKVKGD